MEKQRRFRPILAGLSDLFLLVQVNIRHYSLALWGFGLRLDPDYPKITRFFGAYITDTVLEYRSYPLVVLWSLVLVFCFPYPVVDIFVGAWFSLSRYRSHFYKTPYDFWARAWQESPNKPRVLTRYAENIMMEIERQLKSGKSWEELGPLIDMGNKIVSDVCSIQAALNASSVYMVSMAGHLEPKRFCVCEGGEHCTARDHAGRPCPRVYSVKRDPYCYPCDW